MQVNCNDKQDHSFIMNMSILSSPELLPPKSCHRVHIIASGSITCETKIKLLMDDKETNFMDHLKLKGPYSNTEIYQSDWYQNKFQLKILNGSCIERDFEFIVKFVD